MLDKIDLASELTSLLWETSADFESKVAALTMLVDEIAMTNATPFVAIRHFT